MKFNSTLTSLVRSDLEHNHVPMLLGEPGIGKSSWVEGLAESMGAGFHCLACNQLADKADLTGARLQPKAAGDGFEQAFYPHAVVSAAIDEAVSDPDRDVILFLDELNRTTPDVTSELLSIPTMRSIGDTSLPDNVKVIVAGNDHGNVCSLDEASISRFVLYRVEADVDTFMQVNPGLNSYIADVLKDDGSLLFCKHIDTKPADDNDAYDIDDVMVDDDGMDQITTPRTVSALSDMLNSHDDSELLMWLNESASSATDAPSVLQEVVEGYVGHTAFSVRLLSHIATRLTARTTTSKGARMPVKPAEFDDLMSVPTRDEIVRVLGTLPQGELEACLLWAIMDPRDCANLIEVLCERVSSLSAENSNMLIGCANTAAANRRNLGAFASRGGALGAAYSVVLNLN